MADLTIPRTKVCTKCGEEFPATTEFFAAQKAAKDGLHSWCVNCKREYNRNYATQHRAEKQEYNRRYHEEHREQLRQASRNWSAQHAEWRREYNQHYYCENHEDILEQKKEYYRRTAQHQRDKSAEYRASHPNWNVDYQIRYRANFPDKVRALREGYIKSGANRIRLRQYLDRKIALPTEFTVADWQRALDYFHGCCAVCGRPLSGLFHKAAMDHWIPLSSPDCPGTVRMNIIPLCHGDGGCNNSKHNKHPHEWMLRRFGTLKTAIIEQRIKGYFAWVTQRSEPFV